MRFYDAGSSCGAYANPLSFSRNFVFQGQRKIEVSKKGKTMKIPKRSLASSLAAAKRTVVLTALTGRQLPTSAWLSGSLEDPAFQYEVCVLA